MFSLLKLPIAAAAVLALSLAGCVANGGGAPGTSAEGWRQIAVGTGTVIGATKADAKIAAASDKLAQYCTALQTIAAGAVFFASEKQLQAATIARTAIDLYCTAPPRNVAQTLVLAADTYASAVAIRDAKP